MKEKILLVLLLAAMLLPGCTTVESSKTDSAVPSRMILAIEVSAFPEDETMHRSYSDSDTLTSLLRMIQNLDTQEEPETEPVMDEEHPYYTFTATYADGTQEAYYLVEKQYLRHRNGSWCVTDAAKTEELLQFIINTP